MFDERIAELVATHPDGALFSSLPVAGAALVPRMIVAFGTQRERYQERLRDCSATAGIAPVTEASGNSQWVHARFACPKFLPADVSRVCQQLDPTIGVARAYYEHRRQEKNQSHHAAVRGLAFKWLRIIYRCWKDANPTTRSCTEVSTPAWLPVRRALGLAPALGGRRSPDFKNFQQITLDGLTQKTPLLQRREPRRGHRGHRFQVPEVIA